MQWVLLFNTSVFPDGQYLCSIPCNFNALGLRKANLIEIERDHIIRTNSLKRAASSCPPTREYRMVRLLIMPTRFLR